VAALAHESSDQREQTVFEGRAGEPLALDWTSTGAEPSQQVMLHQAFDCAFPLVAMGRLRAGLLGTDAKPGRSQLNTWQHQHKLSGPDDR